MSGPKRNPDKLNTMGVVVIGICASVLVYVTVVALQAFYMKDTAEVDMMADYGGTDTTFRKQKADALANINDVGVNRTNANEPATSYRVPIDIAMKKVVEDAGQKKFDELVPGVKSTKPTALPIFGKPQMIPSADAGSAPAPAQAQDPASGSGTAPADAGSGVPAAGSGAAAGSGVPMTPTGGQAQAGGPVPPAGTNNPPAAGSAAKGNAP